MAIESKSMGSLQPMGQGDTDLESFKNMFTTGAVGIAIVPIIITLIIIVGIVYGIKAIKK